MDSTLNSKSNPKILWRFNKYNVFSSPKRSRNVLYKRFVFVSLLIFMVLILLRANFSFYYEQFFAEGEQPGWEKTVNISIPHYILPNERTTILEPSTLCKDDQPILLLIVIFTRPDNFAHRQFLRRTWANTTEFNYSKFSKMHAHLKGSYLEINDPRWVKFIKKNSNITNPVNVKDKIEDSEVVVDYSQLDFHVRTAFLIGSTGNEELQYEINEESKTYDDIIQESFLDTYYNLTLKTSMLMKWTFNNCLDKAMFTLKIDEDSFLNVPNLIHYLLGGTVPFYDATLNRHKNQNNQNLMDPLDSKNRLTQHENLLVGSLLCHIKPCSDLHTKWFTPRHMFDGFVYPNFLAGGSGFVFTMDTIAKLYNASMEVPLLIFEDVFVTGLCAEKAGIEPRNFHLFNDNQFLDMCDFRGLITQHHVKPRVQKLVYDMVLNSNTKCVGPSQNVIFGLLNDTNADCSNKFTFGYPKPICVSPFKD